MITTEQLQNVANKLEVELAMVQALSLIHI